MNWTIPGFFVLGWILLSATIVHARGTTAATATADGDPQVIAAVDRWMTAFQKKDAAGLRALGPTTFDEWIVTDGNPLQKNIALESALHPITEYRIERVTTLMPGQLAVAQLQEIIEDEAVREWEATLTLSRAGGIWKVTHASHLVLEFHMPGHPLGCPETVFRREEVASLDGPLRPNADPSFVRVFSTRRDTDPFHAGAGPETDPRKCLAAPETVVQDLEWLVATWSGGLLMAQKIGRATAPDGGITLYDGSSTGSLTRGGVRLETITAGPPAILFLSRQYRGGEKSSSPPVARVSAYVWKGGGLKRVWDLDFIRKGASFSVDLQPGEGGKQIVASLKDGGDGIGCPDGSRMSWGWTGSAFKAIDKAKGGCNGKSWPGEGGILSRNGFTLPPLNPPNESGDGAY